MMRSPWERMAVPVGHARWDGGAMQIPMMQKVHG